MEHKWLNWAKRIQALSQSGIAFSKDPYDIERYEELRDISAEIIAEHTELEIHKIRELFTNDTGYQTPKVDVRGVVFKDDQVLLVKERSENRWSLPGGFCDIGLSPAENVVKEIKEEAGYDVIPLRLLAVLDKEKHNHPPSPYHYYMIFIQCEIIGGASNAGLETSNVGFFLEDRLPGLSIRRNTKTQIHTLFEFLRNPEKAPLFD
ncbi:NUDIX hydrolase [Chungangia koreensis]|uniref:NUDIX hydrolase n=1 Tax=Chungangia koreensis TaxID=752657 RepID=A0ABV8X0D0_9LACT